MIQKDRRSGHNSSPREDVYTRVTDRIVADQPWSAAHTAGRITRPLRSKGTPYRGMNVLLLWGEAVAKGYTASMWMTYRQAAELGAQVRKGEHGSLVVYANSVTRTGTDDEGDEH